MNMKELVAQVVAAHPEISAPTARTVLQAGFEALYSALESAPEGKLSTPLGAFQIASKANRSDPQGEPKRRVTLNVNKAKASAPISPEKAARKAEREAAREERSANKPSAEDKAARKAAREARQAAKAE